MLTEAEAKTKICPLSFAVPGSGPWCCATTGCMAWRTTSGMHERYYVTYGDKPEEEWAWNPTGHKGYENSKVRIERRQGLGWCGLAGKPLTT